MDLKKVFDFKKIWNDTCANVSPSLKKTTIRDCQSQSETYTKQQHDKTGTIPMQPHMDWDWYLTLGGNEECTHNPHWETIEENLRRLNQATDSFLILEQKESQESKNTWFIQCAMASMGPKQGEYMLEIGFTISGRHYLWERFVPDVEQAIEYFSAAYYHKNVDASGFYNVEL